MRIIFTCESCGRRFRTDEKSRGRRGRCAHCGHVMRIPDVPVVRVAIREAKTEVIPTAAGTAEVVSEPAAAAQVTPAFKLSPPESRPWIDRYQALHGSAQASAASSPAPRRQAGPHDSVFHLEGYAESDNVDKDEFPARFELLDEDDTPAGVSPEVERGLREMAEFEKDPRGYQVVSTPRGLLSRFDRSRPAGWFYVKWRRAVGLLLNLLRFIDSFAYLISVPFLMLMIFGLVVRNMAFMHTGAVGVVLANYGRFWTDLLALLIRPYKDGPLQGLAFLFPPYTIYYLTRHWNRVRPIFRRIATSCIPIVLVVLAYGFLQVGDQPINDVNEIPARIEAGEKELRKDIDDAIKKVESEVR
jgi:DNA-directed RNA polymerase subunit RPC12/RpoP